jgi:hypothetical protein
MLSKLFGSILKSHEFDTPEVKLNKKVTNKTAYEHEEANNPSDNAWVGMTGSTPGKKEEKKKQPKPQLVQGSVTSKRSYNELNSIEKHYYDQIKSLLKDTDKSTLRKSIMRMEEKGEISNKQLLVILDMF